MADEWILFIVFPSYTHGKTFVIITSNIVKHCRYSRSFHDLFFMKKNRGSHSTQVIFFNNLCVCGDSYTGKFFLEGLKLR